VPIFLLATLVLSLLSQVGMALGETLVCPTCSTSTIAQGIAETPAGGTVRVKAGTYLESGLTIDKPLRLVGEPGAIIDGAAKADVIRVFHADGVEVSGFEMRGSGRSYIKEFAAIKVEDSNRCLLRGNTIRDSNFGIYLANTKDCEVRENSISGVFGNEADTGNGIHIWQGSGEHIIANKISGQRDGIYFEFVSDSFIAENQSCNNLRYGLHFMFSNTNVYRANEFCHNGAGVAVMYSHHIEMVKNLFHHNQGMASYGLLLKEIRDSKVHDNRFEFDSIGIYMEGSNRSTFTRNSFKDNGWGLRIMGDCEDNIFHSNNFIANTFDVSTNSNANPNSFDGNYWSQYDGYDLDQNQVGDRPFRLVSLSSVIIERIEGAYSLLRSPLLLLLDQIERALPDLTPERMQDSSPLMQPAVLGEAYD
jgi:nitrous oxidase accessory protein